MGRKGLNKTQAVAAGVLLGGAIGSITAFLVAPKKGKEFRSDIQGEVNNTLSATKDISKRIVSNAKDLAEEILSNANHLVDLTKRYTEGGYTGTIEAFQNEYTRVKNSINAAISVYKSYEESSKPTEEIVEDIFSEYEDDESPKFEGMGRRQD